MILDQMDEQAEPRTWAGVFGRVQWSRIEDGASDKSQAVWCGSVHPHHRIRTLPPTLQRGVSAPTGRTIGAGPDRPGHPSSGGSPGRNTLNAAPRPATARLEHEVAAHRPAQLARDVQPEPAAVVGGPLGAALEAPEEPASIRLGDARPVVGDRQPEPCLLRRPARSRRRSATARRT